MKFILLLTVLLFNSALFAKELTVLVLDGWKSKPVANCEVTLKSNVGLVLSELETDDDGKVVFSDLSYGKYSVSVHKIGIDFEGSEYELKLKNDRNITMLLRPTLTYRLQQMAMEDSIYGKVPRERSIEKESALRGPQGTGESESMSGSNNESEGSLRGSQDADESESENEESEEQPETFAEFPGGEMEMKRFIQKNVMYPEISRELGDQGRVYVVFIVEPDGVITHVSVLRGLSPELDEEAKRLVRSMPTWTPGAVQEKNVRARCRLPITFTLQ